MFGMVGAAMGATAAPPRPLVRADGDSALFALDLADPAHSRRPAEPRGPRTSRGADLPHPTDGPHLAGGPRTAGGPRLADEPPPDDQPPEGAAAPWECLAGVEDVPPDGMLALLLEEVDVTTADELMLVETVAAWQRISAWAQLNAALAAAELSRRPSMNPRWSAPAPTNPNVAGDELAMRLGWSKPAANRLVRDGRALENELLLTADAVRDGRLDTPKLRVVTDRLHDRPGQLAWAVQEQVLPGAGTRTPSQLEHDIDRALLEVDPADAAYRLPAAIAKRRVCRPKSLPDGMAGIWAVLPAAAAVRIDATLDATARTARALGDPRTLDQIRADTLVTLATGDALLAGAPGRPHRKAATTSHDGPDDDVPGRFEGAGRGGDVQRRMAADEDGAASTYEDGGSADLPDAWHETGGLEADDSAGAGPPGTNAGPPDTSGPQPGKARIRIPRVRIDVTVALSTLMGSDDKPAELAGFGPISAEQARALAAGGIWRRLVVDPLSGTVLDVGRTRYRPPKTLADHVTARDTMCAGPGCSVPADRCDLDHTDEYRGTPANGAPHNGGTSADNLGPLSRRCHRLKTDGGFTLAQPEPGVFEWRTPAGLAYRVTPGDHGRAERLTGSGGRRHHDNTSSGYPDEPPF